MSQATLFVDAPSTAKIPDLRTVATEPAPGTKRVAHAGDPHRAYLVLRFLLVNLAATALAVAAWLQGLIAPMFVADGTYLSHAIVGVFAVGLAMATMRVWQVSGELDALASYEPERPSLARRHLDLITSCGTESRALLAESLKLRLTQRIAIVTQISSSLVLLGLIGTVVGFVMALAGVDPATSGDANSIAPMVSSLIDGMHTALYTTLIGSVLNVWLDVNYRLLASGSLKLYTGLIEFGERHARV